MVRSYWSKNKLSWANIIPDCYLHIDQQMSCVKDRVWKASDLGCNNIAEKDNGGEQNTCFIFIFLIDPCPHESSHLYWWCGVLSRCKVNGEEWWDESNSQFWHCWVMMHQPVKFSTEKTAYRYCDRHKDCHCSTEQDESYFPAEKWLPMSTAVHTHPEEPGWNF